MKKYRGHPGVTASLDPFFIDYELDQNAGASGEPVVFPLDLSDDNGWFPVGYHERMAMKILAIDNDVEVQVERKITKEDPVPDVLSAYQVIAAGNTGQIQEDISYDGFIRVLQRNGNAAGSLVVMVLLK